MSKIKSLKVLWWLLIVLLLWWAWRDISMPALLDSLSRLTPRALGLLFVINSGILLLFGSRWWLILRGLGYRTPYFVLAAYRLAGFGVSYFTPGPQFGGEPLQVYLLHTKYQVPTDTALASVSLDKIFEVLANFTFLLLGVIIVMWRGLFLQAFARIIIPVSVGIVILLLGYLFALLGRLTPLAWILGLLPFNEKQPRFRAIRQTLLETESQMGEFCLRQPKIVLLATLLSSLIWLVLLGEYLLALFFLGLPVNIYELLGIILFARLAFLTPLPGGLGALEAGQVFAMQSLGFDPLFGVSVSFFIRARDSLFGLLGLGLGYFSRARQK